MALQMKTGCEKCAHVLREGEGAFICSYEWAFCADSASQMKHACPTCEGELVNRPRRKSSAIVA